MYLSWVETLGLGRFYEGMVDELMNDASFNTFEFHE